MTGTNHLRLSKPYTLSLALLTTLVVVWSVLPTFSSAAAEGDAVGDKEAESKTGMMCPMMAGMKDLKLHGDSPPLLAARADALSLTQAQREQLEAIAADARSQARNVLTREQREQLGDASKAMTLMEIAKLRMKETKSSGSQMCPMCMKMMQQKMQDKPASSDSDERSN